LDKINVNQQSISNQQIFSPQLKRPTEMTIDRQQERIISDRIRQELMSEGLQLLRKSLTTQQPKIVNNFNLIGSLFAPLFR